MKAGRRLWLLGPGLVAGALFSTVAPAQGGTPPPDSARARRDTVVIPIPPRPDSILVDSADRGRAGRDTAARADTLKAPLAQAPRPPALDIGGGYVWDRDALFASGAFTLLDLLEQVPGVTSYRAGWLLPPEHASYVGATGRIRVFYDGVELDALHPRAGGLHDLSSVEIWPLEEVMIERAAGELRVHLRSWRVRNTTPTSRTDVATGEYRTNLFRGFFGRRFSNGGAIQAGFQQFGSGEPSIGGDGDQLALFMRTGWAAGPWSVDGYYLRSRRVQEALFRRLETLPALPAMERTTQLAYIRGGYGDPSAPGVWAQAILSSQLFAESSEGAPPVGEDEEVVSPDTSRSRAQYVLAGGWNRGPLELTGTARFRVYEGENYLSPSVRAGYTAGWLSVDGRLERLGEDSTTRLDATARIRPLARVELLAAASLVRPDGGDDARPTSRTIRGEAGFRVGRTWLIGGVVNRQNAVVTPPIVFDPGFTFVEPGTVTGIFAGVRGPVYQDLSLDVVATRWTDAAGQLFYRPQQQLRAQATLDTRWLGRFPRGTFGLRASGIVEYRSDVLFPMAEGASYTTVGATVVGGQLEIRIQEATAFVQSRNMMAIDYELVPGYVMPRNLIIYGVRWHFWN